MKLAQLLAELPQDQLDRLAAEHVRSEHQLSRGALCDALESIIRSYRFVQDFVIDRQPPTFAILTLLLDAPDFAMPASGFPGRVMDETARICDSVARGDILFRDDQLRIYRKVLYEARRSELQLDPSETAILSVLRRELDIAHVEHFLMEHHPDLQEFWKADGCFLHELNALRSAGLVFATEAGMTLLAEDVVPQIRQALGVEMSSHDARRLCSHLQKDELVAALSMVEAKTSGTKEELIDRIMANRIQPSVFLASLQLGALRDICRQAGTTHAGAKDELIDRIIGHFSNHGDEIAAEETPEIIQVVEARALEEQRFKALFTELKGSELGRILERFPDLRQSGSKEVRVATLWAAERAETTFLSVLANRDLELILYRLGLKIGGSKPERIERLVGHFATVDVGTLAAPASEDEAEPSRPDAVVQRTPPGEQPPN